MLNEMLSVNAQMKWCAVNNSCEKLKSIGELYRAIISLICCGVFLLSIYLGAGVLLCEISTYVNAA